MISRRSVFGIFVAGAVLLAVVLGRPRGPLAAQQPSPSPTPAPVIDASLGTPANLPWQIVDPTFSALTGAQAYAGILDRAAYRIEVPDNWNGELLMYAHGYAGEQPLLRVTNPPIREHLIQFGYAWAASSYHENGYDPDLAVQDTLDLRDYFMKRWGTPAHTYLLGTSMGGHIVVASLEQHPGVYDAALAECGVLMQAQEADYLTANAALADYISGVHALPAASAQAAADAIKSQIMPALGPPTDFTGLGKAWESAVKYLTGGPRPFRHQGMVDFNALASGSLTTQPGTSPLTLAGTDDYFTFHIDPGLGFTDADLNANVYRKVADPAFRNADTNPTFALPTGQISVPLLTMHTTGDNFVPIMMEIGYRKLVNAAGNGDLLVQRGVRAPDHCQFDLADREQGWDDLMNWAHNGVKPEGDNFLAPDLTELGRRWTHHVLPGDNAGY
ncbi:MAG: alpha/beta hydrolase family protein [Dehalococcoidia bacterium]